jgi:hypothetical protein
LLVPYDACIFVEVDSSESHTIPSQLFLNTLPRSFTFELPPFPSYKYLLIPTITTPLSFKQTYSKMPENRNHHARTPSSPPQTTFPNTPLLPPYPHSKSFNSPPILLRKPGTSKLGTERVIRVRGVLLKRRQKGPVLR